MIQNTDNFKTIGTNASTATQSGAVPSTTARIYSGLYGHYIAVGTNPTANVGSFFLPVGMSVDISLPLNAKVSALSLGGNGVVTVAY